MLERKATFLPFFLISSIVSRTSCGTAGSSIEGTITPSTSKIKSSFSVRLIGFFCCFLFCFSIVLFSFMEFMLLFLLPPVFATLLIFFLFLLFLFLLLLLLLPCFVVFVLPLLLFLFSDRNRGQSTPDLHQELQGLF